MRVGGQIGAGAATRLRRTLFGIRRRGRGGYSPISLQFGLPGAGPKRAGSSAGAGEGRFRAKQGTRCLMVGEVSEYSALKMAE